MSTVVLFSSGFSLSQMAFFSKPLLIADELDYSFLYLLDVEDHLSATGNTVVHLDTFGSPQRNSACVGRSGLGGE